MKKARISLPLMLILLAGFWLPPVHAGDDEKLFVSLTSDEINRAAMAIMFSHKVLTERKIPVTIFLNVEGVRLADSSIPQAKHPSGKSPSEMLTGFMADGGTVLICPMCMKNVGGIAPEQLLEGVKVGKPDVTWPALFAEGTRILSY
jgi:predicted peroxiredoxin